MSRDSFHVGKMSKTAEEVPVSASGSDAEATFRGATSSGEIQEKPQLPPNGQVVEGLPEVAEKKDDSSVKFFLVSASE